MDETHRRPANTSDNTVEAVGRLSEALETIERARGSLYDFHQLIGHADLLVGDAADQLAAAGHTELADAVRTQLVGRNVLDGRWTFEIIEEFEDGYHAAAIAMEREARDELMEGRRHVYEAEMKSRRGNATPRSGASTAAD